MMKLKYFIASLLIVITTSRSFSQTSDFSKTPQEMMEGFTIGMKRTECDELLKTKHNAGTLKGLDQKADHYRVVSEKFDRTLKFQDKTIDRLQLNLVFRFKPKGIMNALFLDKVEAYLYQSKTQHGTGYFSDEPSFAINRKLQEELKAILVEELDKRGWKYTNVITRDKGSGKNAYATIILPGENKKRKKINVTFN